MKALSYGDPRTVVGPIALTAPRIILTHVHLVRMDFMVPIAIQSAPWPVSLVPSSISVPAAPKEEFWIRSLALAAALTPAPLAQLIGITV